MTGLDGKAYEPTRPRAVQVQQWRAVPGWEGAYEVSDAGRVRSVDRMGADGRAVGGGPVPARTARNGYLLVTLTRGTRRETHQLHRLVLLAFKPGGARRYPQVRHVNGVKSDCRLSNLRWGTQAMNEADKENRRNREGNRRGIGEGNRGGKDKEGRGELAGTSRVSNPWTLAELLSSGSAGGVLGVHGNPDSLSSPANVPVDTPRCPRPGSGGGRS